mmetsp:Transcript_41934/g.100748  ORF Transcript_41934/g.100748 Transcript_41934/m.100748 type:complete len:202 (+) Transcript_41934:353-958(+)
MRPVKALHSAGIGPMMSLRSNLSNRSRSNCDNSGGKSPEKRLFSRNKISNRCNCANPGPFNGPSNRFESKSIADSRTASNNSSGKGPVSSFESRSKLIRFVSIPNVVGIIPWRKFNCPVSISPSKSINCSPSKNPNSLGIGPTRLFSSILIPVIIDPCEHVMPNQKHSLDVDKKRCSDESHGANVGASNELHSLQSSPSVP